MIWWTVRQLRSANPATVRSAIARLGHSGDHGALEALVRFLPNQAFEDEALSAIATHPKACEEIPNLLKLLLKPPGVPSYRKYLATAAQTGAEWLKAGHANGILEEAAQALDADYQCVHEAAVAILTAAGPGAQFASGTAVEGLLQTQSPERHRSRIQLLDTIDAQWRASKEAAKVFDRAAETLKELPPPPGSAGARDHLVRMATAGGSPRKSAILTLAEASSPKPEPFRAALDDPDTEVAEAAAAALCRHSDVGSVEALRYRIYERDILGRVREACLHALAKVDHPSAGNALLDIADQHSDFAVRLSAMKRLSESGVSEVFDLVAREVRRSAAAALLFGAPPSDLAEPEQQERLRDRVYSHVAKAFPQEEARQIRRLGQVALGPACRQRDDALRELREGAFNGMPAHPELVSTLLALEHHAGGDLLAEILDDARALCPDRFGKFGTPDILHGLCSAGPGEAVEAVRFVLDNLPPQDHPRRPADLYGYGAEVPAARDVLVRALRRQGDAFLSEDLMRMSKIEDYPRYTREWHTVACKVYETVSFAEVRAAAEAQIAKLARLNSHRPPNPAQ